MENLQTVKQRFGIIGNDVQLSRAIEKAVRVSPTDISVLVTGESGVGKESIPKIIHQLSHRKHAKYIAVNCGAIPEGTIDSELFGHEKGAFSGASSAKKGRFELADKGTLLLDEIGEMPLSMQVKLLRVLQEQVIDRVGSEKPRSIDVRIVAATHQNLSDKVAARDFREDLYYRLNVFPIQMPPLRERGEDILLLWDFFAQELCVGDDSPVSLSMAAAHDLMQRQWKGNCRELRNLVERMNILYPGAEITLQNLQPSAPMLVSDMLAVEGQVELALYPQALESNRFGVTDLVEPPRLFEPLVIGDQSNDIDGLADMLVSAIDMSQGCDLKQQLIAVETQLIQKALDATSGNVSKAADLLSVRRTTLIEKIKKYQLQEVS